MKIFGEICRALREEGTATLVTIIASSGSTPAPRQSRMLIRGQGKKFIGTIGGGCLEANIISRVSGGPRPENPGIMLFHLNDDLGESGLSCGGTIEVLAEILDGPMLPAYECIFRELKSGNDVFLVTDFRNDRKTTKMVLDHNRNVIAGPPPDPALLDPLLGAMEDHDAAGRAARVQTGTGTVLLERLSAEPPVIVFGGGHVGLAVTHLASIAGFRVTVVDDREEFAHADRFPDAEHVYCETFESACGRLQPTPDTSVVIATRGHRSDEVVLAQMLAHDLKYIGMIGSRRKVMLTRKRLAEAGVPAARLSTVHAPIGLAIGARTPEEIGISIVAQLIAVRRGNRGAPPREDGGSSLSHAHSAETRHA